MTISEVLSNLNQMQNNTNKVNYETGRNNLGSNRLDKNAFMQLLLTQLKYQDPLEPVDNAQFLQQQAMMSQVESMDELNKNFSRATEISQASTMVGKYVAIQVPNQATGLMDTITGPVSSVSITDNGTALSVNGTNYPLSMVSQIYAEDPTP
ncbi:MAG: flagellar hook assembly protein FlgD [Candidatus Melainabacteria bacterium]